MAPILLKLLTSTLVEDPRRTLLHHTNFHICRHWFSLERVGFCPIMLIYTEENTLRQILEPLFQNIKAL